jgi:hypothetical protein
MHAKLAILIALTSVLTRVGLEARARSIQEAVRCRAVALDPRDRQRALHQWHLD